MEIRVEITGIIITFTIPDEPEQSTKTQVQCSDCGWTKSYDTPALAKRGLAAHQYHCPGPHDELTRVRNMLGFERDEEQGDEN
jgi:hypothetical protein